MKQDIEPSQMQSPLTPEQWAGLARLGDLGQRIGGLIDGPAAGPATAALDRIGELDGQYDLVALTEKLIDTVSALDRAGLLDLIRDNAQFVSDSMEVLRPMATQWMERIREVPVDELKADAAFALDMLHKARLMASFIEANLSGGLTGKTVELTAFIEQNQTDKALAEAFVQLGRIYRSGLLARLGDLSEYIAGLEEGTDLESQVGSVVKAIPGDTLGTSFKLLRSVSKAMAGIQEDPHEKLGGFSGLLHVMRDKEVQKGLRLLARTAGRIDEQP